MPPRMIAPNGEEPMARDTLTVAAGAGRAFRPAVPIRTTEPTSIGELPQSRPAPAVTAVQIPATTSVLIASQARADGANGGCINCAATATPLPAAAAPRVEAALSAEGAAPPGPPTETRGLPRWVGWVAVGVGGVVAVLLLVGALSQARG